jgi:Uncharacterized protein conserved in bacteria (DUF2330)
MTYASHRSSHPIRAIRIAPLAPLALLAVMGMNPTPAQACGGTFCDSGPQVMPVDQTGESIIFWIDHSGSEPHTEAHIQIQYEGDAENFAWIIPVTAVPEVFVSSQALFDNILQATVPTFTINTTTIGDCSFGFGCAMADSVGGTPNGFGSFSTSGQEGSDTNGGPEVLDRGFAGAFEYVTLTGDSVQEIVDWLDMAGYAQDPDAPPILEEYLQEDFVFVAVKLKGGADVDEIHPLGIRYAGIEPCIPIKLTRIAAVDDMKIRALFLGEGRLVPTNWPHVEVNHSRYDWVNGPSVNYDEVVSLAIDEAGGRAFVTEYAGTDDVVSTSGVFDSRWSAAKFEDIDPTLIVDELTSQGLIACDGEQCAFNHPQVQALLEIYLPAPDGVTAGEFWSCLSCYEGLIDPVAWSAQPGFGADFQDRLSGPGQHAVDMLADATYLTRMFTLLSPHEMLEDPTFHETDALPTVDNNVGATRVNDCDSGPSYIELFDGRRIALTDGGTMPDLEGNPAALRIEQVPMMGPAQIELDNTGTIDALLDEYNDTRLAGPEGGCSIGRVGIEALFGLFAIFGIAWFNRGGRR